jgi:uncharacterized LabA/DUF88 family protein
MPTAIVIDGAYFLRRFKHSFPNIDATLAENICVGVVALARFHVRTRLNSNPVLHAIDGGEFDSSRLRVEESPELYRIFFYDCAPLAKRMHYPVSGRAINFANTDEAQKRMQIHDTLGNVRKVALRLGRLNEEHAGWKPKPEAVKKWLLEPTEFSPTDEDFEIAVTQKGVDMRLGLDIASMAFKRQVDQIVIVAGDADFVPAAKLARREGIDVVLDPMHGQAAADLLAHVDGVREFRHNGGF